MLLFPNKKPTGRSKIDLVNLIFFGIASVAAKPDTEPRFEPSEPLHGPVVCLEFLLRHLGRMFG
jgi:hypothetical protein